ncbi:MAG: NAD(+) diphosphatase [Erysipelotrichaceae bacterium]|nr:NAD(+) diphosphatase [Erysipelotrichaceae bacterium]
MIQDIYPKKFKNEYIVQKPKDNDFIIQFDNNCILLNKDNSFVKYHQIKEDINLYYCFSIDNDSVFLTTDLNSSLYCRLNVKELRYITPKWLAFLSVGAYQLNKWLIDNKYCGRCATLMNSSSEERAQICPNCNNVVYPKISPAIIVLIKDNDRILLTKYAHGFGRYALVAGFCEIGETLEDTIKREIFEEVGLKVKNIKYYKSQPWSFSESLLSGFVCDLDGDDKVILDTKELKEATWFTRDELPDTYDDISLTQELMRAFKYNNL